MLFGKKTLHFYRLILNDIEFLCTLYNVNNTLIISRYGHEPCK